MWYGITTTVPGVVWGNECDEVLIFFYKNWKKLDIPFLETKHFTIGGCPSKFGIPLLLWKSENSDFDNNQDKWDSQNFNAQPVEGI